MSCAQLATGKRLSVKTQQICLLNSRESVKVHKWRADDRIGEEVEICLHLRNSTLMSRRGKFIDFFSSSHFESMKKERRIKTAILCTRRLSTWTAQQQRARVKPYEKELYVFKREMRSDLEHSLSFQHWKLYICATYENVVEIRNSFRIHQSQLDRWLCFLRWSQHFPSIKRFSHLLGIPRRFCDLLHSTFWSCGRFWASSRSRTCVFLVCEFKIA